MRFICAISLLVMTSLTFAGKPYPRSKNCRFYLNQLMQAKNVANAKSLTKKVEGEVILEVFDYVLNFRKTITYEKKDIAEIDIETINYIIEIKSGKNLALKQIKNYLSPRINPKGKKLIILALQELRKPTDPSFRDYEVFEFIEANDILVLSSVEELKTFLKQNEQLVFKEYE